jgi:hypothetical protein
MNRAAGLIGVILLALTSSAVCALEFRRHNVDSPRLNAISARGKIVEGDTERLVQYIEELPNKANTAIYLASPGGNMIEGIKLGYLLQQMRIKTIVEGDPPNNFCYSACALAFLGGHDSTGGPWRSSTTNSHLGFHQFYCVNESGRESKCVADVGDTQRFVAFLLEYGRQVRAPMEIFIAAISTPPTHVHEFTMSELCSLGIKVWDMQNNRFMC